MRLIAICSLFAAVLAAADVAGTWQGTIATEMARETTGGTVPAFMVLRQSDGRITGTAGPSEDMQFQIRNGSLEGERLTVEASPKEGSVLRFVLTLKDGTIEGEVQENGTVIGTAKLTRLR